MPEDANVPNVNDDAESSAIACEGAGVEEKDLSERVLQRLLAAHGVWFDTDRDRELAGRVFPGFAEFHSYGERYVLTRRAKLWEVATHELIFFEKVGCLDEDAFGGLVELMKTEAVKLVEPGPNHMSTNISLVVIADAVEPGVERAVRRTRFRKNFKWGLWGWSDLHVAVVDLSRETKGRQGRVTANAAGGQLRKTIEANLLPASQTK